jgi:hypothetical protein
MRGTQHSDTTRQQSTMINQRVPDKTRTRQLAPELCGLRAGVNGRHLRDPPPHAQVTPIFARNLSFSVLKLTDRDNLRGLNQAPSPNCYEVGNLYSRGNMERFSNSLGVVEITSSTRFAINTHFLLLGALCAGSE